MADEAHLRSAVPVPWAADYREKAVHYCTTPSISVESLYVFCAYTLPGPSLGSRGRPYAMDLLQLTHRDYTFYMMILLTGVRSPLSGHNLSSRLLLFFSCSIGQLVI